MELVNEFTVNVPVRQAWDTLTDVELIAPCLPGAQLQEIEGDAYRGVVKVKVGPITAQFKGEANFVERDETNHVAVLKAAGRDTGGKGNASALITARLEPKGDTATQVTVTTDLTITGKVAQFGRGALADVSSKLIKQFVEQLETMVLTPTGTGSAPSGDGTSAPLNVTEPYEATAVSAATGIDAPSSLTSAGAPAGGTTAAPAASPPQVRKIESPEAKPIDLLDAAGAPLVKRLAPVAVVVLLVLLILRRRRH